MKHIIGAFSILLVLVVNIFVCMTLITVNVDVVAAKEYKAAVVAEIENSNFNPLVIQECITQAAAEGYTLKISSCSYDTWDGSQTAEVLLQYSYRLPLFGIWETKVTRGIAR